MYLHFKPYILHSTPWHPINLHVRWWILYCWSQVNFPRARPFGWKLPDGRPGHGDMVSLISIIWGCPKMEDPQVSMGFNAKWWFGGYSMIFIHVLYIAEPWHTSTYLYCDLPYHDKTYHDIIWYIYKYISCHYRAHPIYIYSDITYKCTRIYIYIYIYIYAPGPATPSLPPHGMGPIYCPHMRSSPSPLWCGGGVVWYVGYVWCVWSVWYGMFGKYGMYGRYGMYGMNGWYCTDGRYGM